MDSRYQVRFDPKIFENGYLNIKFGYKKNHAGYLLEHNSMKDVQNKTLEFKHTSRNRRWWTSHEGMEFTLSIPLDKIILVPIKGYSYVAIVINGIPLRLNVSGGTRDGWTDHVSESCFCFVNFPIRKMKKIMEVAILPEPPFYRCNHSSSDLNYEFSELIELPTDKPQHKYFKLKFIGAGKKSWCLDVIKQHYKSKKMYVSKDTVKGRKLLEKKVRKELGNSNKGYWVALETEN